MGFEAAYHRKDGREGFDFFDAIGVTPGMGGVKNIFVSIIDRLASANWKNRKVPAGIQTAHPASPVMIPIAIEDKLSYL